MVTDHQVRRLFKMVQKEKILKVAASKSGMDEKTARKYIRLGKLPSQTKKPRTWRTREDPFKDVWEEVKEYLSLNRGLEAKTIFEEIQRKYPGRYSDGQIRTLQRRIKQWKALEGPHKEVYFPQKHKPGELCASDFTRLSKLGVTINGRSFPHMLYHFVLTYSNWETGTVCFGESFESISEGLQNALWELGGVPRRHLTDRLSAAVRNVSKPAEFTERYKALLSHYKLEGFKIQAGKANENGDIEQRHHRFKRALNQALILRNSRDFASREEYKEFLTKLFSQLNAGRKKRQEEELSVLRRLPYRRLNDSKIVRVKVGQSSTIRIAHNVYSVDSRLIGEYIDVRLKAEYLEVWYAQRMLERIPRLRGERNSRINYRHIIDWLVRKPGAFENYRYQESMFPSSSFRMSYDLLRKSLPAKKAVKEYLSVLNYSSKEGESKVNDALRMLIDKDSLPTFQSVKEIVESGQEISSITDVSVDAVNISVYDQLLQMSGVLS